MVIAENLLRQKQAFITVIRTSENWLEMYPHCHSTGYELLIRPKAHTDNLVLLSHGVKFLSANI
jgi:hypothetical protein